MISEALIALIAGLLVVVLVTIVKKIIGLAKG